MSIPLGVFAYQAYAPTKEEILADPPANDSLLDLSAFLTESACKRYPGETRSTLKRSLIPSFASRATKRRSATTFESFTNSLFSRSVPSRPRVNSAATTRRSSHQPSIPLVEAFRPIPFVGAHSHAPSSLSDPGSTTASTLRTRSSADSVPFGEVGFVPYSLDPNALRFPQRHVDVRSPDWDCPVLEIPVVKDSPSLVQACFELLDSHPTSVTPRDGTMIELNGIVPSPDRPNGPQLANGVNGSHSGLGAAHGSQASLIGMRAEYESASEAESTNQDTPSQDANRLYQSPPASRTSHLSGLVCNVHRTSGKEPPPLVGATTTVLGDRLYVFGGRRLSRTKPQLTSNLYELDLIKRHWTKLDTSGDIPPPRYFHSVCALGDTKLVCYGGMSPSLVPDGGHDAPQEVIVMSDVHIYDVPSRTWTRIFTPDAPQGRYAHCAAILPSSAVFASPNAPMSALQHNPAGSNANQGSLGVTLDGTGGAEMIVVGGQDSANHYIEQISIFNLRSLKWTGTTGMGRSCGAYRSVVTPLTSMTAAEIGAGPHARHHLDDDDDESAPVGSGAPMLIYSNYNFLDVKLELQVRLLDGTLTEKTMHTAVSPPGLRFPSGGVIDNHFVVSGTFLTSTKQEYALWALDLRTLTWSRIDAGGNIFGQGSWNRGVLWNRRNAFVILGNRRRSLVDDYNNRRINFSNICIVELEAFGLYDNPRTIDPTGGYISASVPIPRTTPDVTSPGRPLYGTAEDIGSLALNNRELSDMDFLAIDGTRIPVNSRLIARRWGPHFIGLLRESLLSASENDTATLRPSVTSNPSRNSSVTITPSTTSAATTLTNNFNASDLPDVRTAPPQTRSRLFYLPHTPQTLRALLHYLYTSSLPSPPNSLATPQTFCSLLQLARPYRIDGLLEAAVEKLHECLDGRNAAAIFNAAAMAAGGGDSLTFASNDNRRSIRESDIPIRTASLAGFDSLLTNGASRGSSGLNLRIDTDVANGHRTARNTLRPGQQLTTTATNTTATDTEDTDDDDVPSSATTDTSVSDASVSDAEHDSSLMHPGIFATRQKVVWKGAMSSVVGLQKRGLRGLMEGRRMRERGRSEAAKVGLGIA